MSYDDMDEFKDLFSPFDNLRYLELWNFKDVAKNIIRDRSFDGSNPIAWLLHQEEHDHCEEVLEGLRIIFSEGLAICWDHDPSNTRIPHTPLRMRQDTFAFIAQTFSLPLSYLRMLREGSTVFIELQNVPSILKGDTQSFMIQNSFTSTTHFSVALTYDPERRLTSVFVHGLSQDEIDALIKDVIAQRESIAFPMLLPSLLLNFRMGSASIKVRDCHLQVVEIEHETGFQTNWGANKQCCSVSQRQPAGRNRYDVIDFDRVTGDLTSLSSKLAYCEYVCEVFLPMVERFDIINGRLLQIVSSENKKRLAKMEARLRAENAFLRSCLRGTLCRAQYLSKRSQAQVQTVFSLIAQKDNALSMRDNAALKMISEDQKQIALAATRDSAAMSVISVITIVFLPATFTATLFSTTFFDFQAGRDGQVVSIWLWLYFVVTIFLSTLIFIWWYLTARHKVQKIDNAFGAVDEKLGVELELNRPRASDEKKIV